MSQIILSGSGLVFLFSFILLYLCNQVNFVTFNTNLSLFRKNVNYTLNPTPNLWLYLLVLQASLLSEYLESFCIQLLLHFCPHFLSSTNISKGLALGFHISRILIVTDSISSATLLSIFFSNLESCAK